MPNPVNYNHPINFPLLFEAMITPLIQGIESSFGFFSYFDRTFNDWTRQLILHPLLDEDHWTLQCPTYLFSCCPRITPMKEVSILAIHSTAAHVFLYTLMRRLAETVAGLVAAWLLTAWIVATVVYCCMVYRRWQIPSQDNYRYIMDSAPPVWSLKPIWMPLSLLPLSIFLPFLVDVAFGILPLTGDHHRPPSNSWFMWLWHTPNVIRPLDNAAMYSTPSVLDLLYFFSLHQILYGSEHQPPHTSLSVGEKLCRQTGTSLSWWSILIFSGITCGIISVIFYLLVYRPTRWLISCLLSDDSDRCRNRMEPASRRSSLLCAAREIVYDKCFKKILKPEQKRSSSGADFTVNVENPMPSGQTNNKPVKQVEKYQYSDSEFFISKMGDCRSSAFLKKRDVVRNSKPESGDGPEVIGLPKGCSPAKSIIRPRYVTRGTIAHLDWSSSDEIEYYD